jgi:hypothetical protein
MSNLGPKTRCVCALVHLAQKKTLLNTQKSISLGALALRNRAARNFYACGTDLCRIGEFPAIQSSRGRKSENGTATSGGFR